VGAVLTVPGVDAEEALLGILLNHGDYFHEVSMIVREQEFYKEDHRLIWRAMEALIDAGIKIDTVSVVQKLRDKRCITRVGGPAAISSLTDTLSDPSNVIHYAKAVLSASIGRWLKSTGRKLANDDIDPERRLDIGFSALHEINKAAAFGNRVHVGDVADEIMSDITGGNGFSCGVWTGFTELDDPLNGLQRQSYYILGARPSVGKSALALQIAAHVADSGDPVLYISPEMTRKQLVIRLMSIKSGVPYDAIIKNRTKEDDRDSLNEARAWARSIPLHVDDSSGQTISNVRLVARQHEGIGLGLLVVDYLQLLCPDDDDKATVTKISKGLKAIAKDFNIPVLACSQLRRRYGQEPVRPDSSRLKGSGQIEQDADAIILLHRKDNGMVEAFLDKHRNGPLGQTVLRFDKETTRFSETEVW
jgi:replicative DNA helicase